MKSTLGMAVVGSMVAGLMGCAANPLVGHGATWAGRYNGTVGVSGNGTTVTIETGSDVPLLSIVGDGSKVMVEEGVILRKIEFWGNANTVSVPENLQVLVAAMGTNQIVRRPVGAAQPAQPDPASSRHSSGSQQ